MRARVHSVFQVFAQFFVRSLDVHTHTGSTPGTTGDDEPRYDDGNSNSNNRGSGKTSFRPRGERVAAETRAIYGRVRQIRQEKLGLSQISRYAWNPGAICNAIKRRGEIRIIRDREKKCKPPCRKQTQILESKSSRSILVLNYFFR